MTSSTNRHDDPYWLELINRITDRDIRILSLVADHHVLTTGQIARLEFGSETRARHRLVALHRYQVLDRFRPKIPSGSTPCHYTLSRTGATVLAAHRGVPLADLGYRHDRATRLALSQHLTHRIGVNDLFADLAAVARRTPGTALVLWWPEEKCARTYAPYVRPDALGRWQDHNHTIDFFLEYDTGTEPLGRVAAKMTGYARLQHATGIRTPVLIWTSSPTREANLNHRLRTAPVPVATSTARAAARCPSHGPAGPIWLPTTPDMQRLPLIDLAQHREHDDGQH